jgi:hypothetical protein
VKRARREKFANPLSAARFDRVGAPLLRPIVAPAATHI